MTAVRPLRRGDGHGAGRQAEPLTDLLAHTTEDLTALLRSEVELAKAELREEARAAGRAGAALGAGAVLALLALALLGSAAAWGLAEVMAPGFAFLVVAVVVAAAAGAALLVGRSRLAQVDVVPRQTIDSLEEDVRWLRQLRS